jgi:ankyrin repeat protein
MAVFIRFRRRFFSADIVLRRTDVGNTLLHEAAENGHLNKIPIAQLTLELLLTRNDNGDTPLHAAAYEGHLDQVPPELLSLETVNTRNYDSATVARTAMERGFHEQIPDAVRPKAISPFRQFLRHLGRSKVPF